MQGLAGVYQYMDMKSEYEVLMKIITDGASYTSFPSRLLAYNEALKKTEGVAQQQDLLCAGGTCYVGHPCG